MRCLIQGGQCIRDVSLGVAVSLAVPVCSLERYQRCVQVAVWIMTALVRYMQRYKLPVIGSM
jgi:hypothetical protein